jgi:hypothetical protein
MAIKFKVIERGQPGVPGGGEKKFYKLLYVWKQEIFPLPLPTITKAG